jgi:hypothetical protein
VGVCGHFRAAHSLILARECKVAFLQTRFPFSPLQMPFEHCSGGGNFKEARCPPQSELPQRQATLPKRRSSGLDVLEYHTGVRLANMSFALWFSTSCRRLPKVALPRGIDTRLTVTIHQGLAIIQPVQSPTKEDPRRFNISQENHRFLSPASHDRFERTHQDCRGFR